MLDTCGQSRRPDAGRPCRPSRTLLAKSGQVWGSGGTGRGHPATEAIFFAMKCTLSTIYHMMLWLSFTVRWNSGILAGAAGKSLLKISLNSLHNVRNRCCRSLSPDIWISDKTSAVNGYEIVFGDWSSDVCSSDLLLHRQLTFCHWFIHQVIKIYNTDYVRNVRNLKIFLAMSCLQHQLKYLNFI